MGFLVVNGALCQCSFGAAPSALVVVRPTITAGNQPAANINDNKPNTNVMPFAMCQSLSNPAVASATTAASGVLTPQTCTPVTTAPWTPGCVKVQLDGAPALHDGCTLMCSFAGVIKINSAGQTVVQAS